MIVDTHIHLYDPARPQGVPWPDPKEQIYRTILPKDFRKVAAPAGVTHAIIVEASPWLEDNQWILDQIADETGILGFVGNLDIGSEEFLALLERFAANPLFRGIRARNVESRNLRAEPYKSNLKKLSSLDMSLDLLARTQSFGDVASLAREVPDLRIVINHLGHPSIDGGDAPEDWREGIQRCAEQDNIFCKVSRITEAAVSWPAPTDMGFYRPILEHLWQSFGPSRLLWGSNWPVAERAGDYATTLTIVDDFLQELDGGADREALLCETSRKAYHWRKRE
jgi:L-fuconolactonase